MKSLLAGLFVVAVSGTTVHAESVATVEQKVVEIHMASKETAPVEESKRRKSRRIETLPFSRGTCSGEFIDAIGDILTARHCVEGFATFEVVTADHQIYSAVVVATSTAHDLALIHIDRINTPYFELAETVTRGESISVLGSPLGITDTLSRGVVARLDGDVTLLDCSALPGNSGGPVYNRDEKLVGVLSAGFIVLFGTTHLNIAQSRDAVAFFLRDFFERRYGR